MHNAGEIKRDKGRESKGRVLPIYLLHILLIPAFLPFILLANSCENQFGKNENIGSEILLTKTGEGKIRHIDILFFNNDKLQKLDSYQRIEYTGQKRVYGTSRQGNKILAVIANKSDEIYSWSDIESYLSFSKTMIDLDSDSPLHPIMSGINYINAGVNKATAISIKPLLTKVLLRNISCDFSGKEYQNHKLEDVRIYLTNVNHKLSPCTENGAQEFINIGGLDIHTIEEMNNPQYVYKSLTRGIGKDVQRVDIDLYCYPNTTEEESMGSPFTRLVIEGKIDGVTYYYPLTINRRDGGNGVERNVCYIYDVRICRKGTGNPDTAIDRDMAEISMEICDWTEKEGGYVGF